MLKRLLYEKELLLISLGFLTRFPLPTIKEFTENKLNHSSRYFPLTGLIIGLFCALAFAGSQLFFSPIISAVLSTITGIFITGAFHEDGLADTFDGFGGAFEKENKLIIMKDSRIGTYGSVALWAILTLKVALLAELAQPIAAIITAHCLSRANAISLTNSLQYVQDSNSSKSKPLAQKLSIADIIIILLTSLATLAFLPSQAIYILFALLLVRQFCIFWFKKQIGGFTGDTLGSCQQLSEICIYASLIISVKIL